jgi:SRSO17 transposase
MTSQCPSTWRRELGRWLAPFLAGMGHRARRRWAPRYGLGLLGPSERKAIQPLATRVAPADGEQLHHFVAASTGDPAPVEAVLAREAQRLVGGDEAVLIVDDTALPNKGEHSVWTALSLMETRPLGAGARRRSSGWCLLPL